MPVVTIVHTSFLAVESLTALFAEIAPDVELRHVVEDGLLAEVIAEGGVSPSARERLLGLFEAAAASGCDVVLSQCSSVGEVADQAAARTRVPIVKIDVPMAERACELGSRIGVVATLATTLGPTTRLLESVARARGLKVEVEELLVDGAFGRLERGDRVAHDALVVAAVRALAGRVDIVVCAQGSMAAIQQQLADLPAPVLTSPRLGIERAVALARGAVAEGEISA